ncbi:MAG: gas vesicle structural protein GvpA [Actinobacteria bacterium]|nr:gas vesicle structural protein GvpA [Actinomycetota bacterium]
MSATSLARRPPSGSLAEVVDIILDKGLVIDAFVRVSLVGIELLTIDARIVVASVDTYLHFAEAVDRLDIRGKADEYDASLTDIVGGLQEKGAEAKTKGALQGASDRGGDLIENSKQRIKSAFGGGSGDDGGGEDEGDDDS